MAQLKQLHSGRGIPSLRFIVGTCLLIAAATTLLASAENVQVHLIPHSHQDPGYRETVYGYWRDSVSDTLRTTVQALQDDPTRRFVWEETIWLRYLWESGDADTINGIQHLVKNGQLELIGGGWVMHDEAGSSLWSTANQMTIGLDFLFDKFKTRPKWAWHIDPFGHSVTSPSVFASLGYSAFVINRIPDDEKQERKANRSLELLWTGSTAQHPDSTLLAHVLDSHYATPVLPGVTAAEKAKQLAEQCAQRAKWYRTKHVLVPFGNDFEFKDARLQFDAMDEILRIINNDPASHSNVTIKYSTLNEYFTALHADPNAVFPAAAPGKDFFPYIACSPCTASKCIGLPCGSRDAYWVGYYTSRPHQKLMSFKQDALARSLNILQTLQRHATTTDTTATTSTTGVADADLVVTTARNTSGLMQHHDALPGTSFNYCTISTSECDCVADYNKRIAAAAQSSDNLIGNIEAKLLGVPGNVSVVTAATLANSSYSSPEWTIFISNPVAWRRRDVVQVDIAGVTTSRVINVKTGEIVPSQVVVDPLRGKNFVYIAVDLPPLAIATYRLELGVVDPQQQQQESSSSSSFFSSSSSSSSSSLCNGAVCITFSSTTGRPTAWVDLASGTTHALNVDHVYMRERTPVDADIFSGSNVYDFTPDGTSTSLWPARPTLVSVANGPIVWEQTATLSGDMYVSFRLYNASLVDETQRSLQVQTHTGVMTSASSGSMLMRVSTDVKSGTAFFTDNNAFQRKHRTFDSSLPYSGNFYPVVGAAIVTDANTTARPRAHRDSDSGGFALSLAASRPTAVTSPASGALEMMLHRRIMDLDLRGNDSSVMDDVVLVTLAPASVVQARAAKMSTLHLLPVTVHAVSGRVTPKVATFAPMPKALPDGVHLLDVRLRGSGFDEGVGMWLQGLAGLDGGKVDPSEVLPCLSTRDWERTSLDFRLSINETRSARLKWKSDSSTADGQEGHAAATAAVNVKPESFLAFAS
ncbi:hypothetical protein PTSG_06807 [Salpingoeca rosetta]|uniref:Glycoside hydrolase family 38 central domain-containing protein n=1 Tax=Salpingoeca rosetta (strain ATCC 50818 / BSB-021) TaxID=946362 RepID=F2UEV3_SALR5|nr:uncharacterized protein PTSG_06807 [Salpingoeca rosetta]EGD75153.1 hypothetical protein PTSG_06807 [Salpingoeca rosetta]|eukprot:XP_004992206.1 hypothetical protein PTSG_06807 [Salpingoeca rosetta]